MKKISRKRFSSLLKRENNKKINNNCKEKRGRNKKLKIFRKLKKISKEKRNLSASIN